MGTWTYGFVCVVAGLGGNGIGGSTQNIKHMLVFQLLACSYIIHMQAGMSLAFIARVWPQLSATYLVDATYWLTVTCASWMRCLVIGSALPWRLCTVLLNRDSRVCTDTHVYMCARCKLGHIRLHADVLPPDTVFFNVITMAP